MTRIDHEKARRARETEQIDPRDTARARERQARSNAYGKALATGLGRRRRDAANEAARLQALAAGEVFAPSVVRRDPRATPAPTPDQPPDPAPQSSEEMGRAQACSDAKREALRSNAIRASRDEHPQFPGRPAGWQPNRRQRRILREQGLL